MISSSTMTKLKKSFTLYGTQTF